jgi:hypothetical protein
MSELKPGLLTDPRIGNECLHSFRGLRSAGAQRCQVGQWRDAGSPRRQFEKCAAPASARERFLRATARPRRSHGEAGGVPVR